MIVAVRDRSSGIGSSNDSSELDGKYGQGSPPFHSQIVCTISLRLAAAFRSRRISEFNSLRSLGLLPRA